MNYKHFRFITCLVFITFSKFEFLAANKNSKVIQKHSFNYHTNKVNCVAVSNNNRFLATGSWDGTIIIWNYKERTIKYIFDENQIGQKHFIIDLNFSNDNNFLISASSNHKATIWNVNTGQKVTDLVGHNDFVMSANFSNDNSFILTTSYDYSACVWDLNGNLKAKLKHIEPVKAAKISNNSNFFVTACKNITYVWDSKTLKCKHQLVNPDNTEKLVISNDNTLIITGGNGVIVGWDSATGQALYTKKTNDGSTMTLNISNNDEFLVTGSTDLYSCLVDPRTGQIKNKLYEHFWVAGSAISKDNKYLITCGNWVSVRDLNTGELIEKIQFKDTFLTLTKFVKHNFVVCNKNELLLYKIS